MFAHYAKTMPGRGLHQPPAVVWLGDAARTQQFQCSSFGVNVVSLDIQVQPRLVLHPLYFDVQAGLGILEWMRSACPLQVIDHHAHESRRLATGRGAMVEGQ